MYFKEIKIPKEVAMDFSGSTLKAKGPKGESEKRLIFSKGIKVEKTEQGFKVSSETDDRTTRAQIGTVIAHMRNAVDGVTNEFVYKLKVIYSHFPVTVKAEKDKVLVQNFLGERTPRVAKILGSAKVKVEGADISVSGTSLDDVSQTAANIEQACRIVGYDKKIFQDGIYITSKAEKA
jgi:large subunit ribosomal protein L6